MLARSSAAASQVESSAPSNADSEHFVSLDMDTFRLVLPVPDITWGNVAQMCERAVNPMCKGLYSILEQDMEHVAHVLAALEDDSERVDHYMVPCTAPDEVPSTDPNVVPKPDPLIIRSSNPSVPTIVITPCTRQPRETSCQVPYQDSAFRNQLTVPSLPSFNQSFPPMVPPRRVLARGVNHWIWKNGHWQAALGAIEPRPRVLKHRKKSRVIKSVPG